MNLILVGFMGCGKSSVGLKLAEKASLTFVDTDAMIEQESGMSISEIFASKGENVFRDMETEYIRTMIANAAEGMLLSTGGGMPVRAVNRELLKKLGKVIYLRVTPETVYERLKGDTTRPLLQTQNPLSKIRELQSQRRDAYEDAADLIVDVDGKSVDAIVQEIMSKME